jgi:tricorn protease
MSFDLTKEKAETFMSGVSGYSLAAATGKIAIMKRRGEIYVVGTGAPPGNDLSDSKVTLDGAVLELDPREEWPREEWAQIFYEGWRLQREFYWDADMAGVPWEKVRDQYATLLPRLATRGDLRDLMGELIGELSTSHTYVFGGDSGVSVPRVPTGLLGADLVREGTAFRVERIYRGASADNEHSPLGEAGVDIEEGDYLLAVNGVPFDPERPVHASFEGLAGKEVLMTVNESPAREGAMPVVVTTLRGDRGLRYADWVRRNREYVARKTDNRIGYIHLPDMSFDGLIEFNTWYYPQIDREGMVVDVRWNRGGFVSDMVVERLRREVIAFQRARNGLTTTYPGQVLNGPIVVLINEYAGSDGDMFPKAIQLIGLGPIIGKRSWGGVVGIRLDKRLVDEGFFTRPEFAWWDAEHGWGLENHGVDPDIDVETLPNDLARGIDAQLDRAIEEVKRLRAEKPPARPDYGTVRPRSRDDYRTELSGAH